MMPGIVLTLQTPIIHKNLQIRLRIAAKGTKAKDAFRYTNSQFCVYKPLEGGRCVPCTKAIVNTAWSCRSNLWPMMARNVFKLMLQHHMGGC